MIGLCLCLLLCFPTVYAFISIRSLLSTQAVVISVLDEVTNELLDRPLVIREFNGLLNHHVDYFYFGCALSSVSYFAFQYIYIYPYINKFKSLSIYGDSYRNIRVFMFIIIILFMRDIENAI